MIPVHHHSRQQYSYPVYGRPPAPPNQHPLFHPHQVVWRYGRAPVILPLTNRNDGFAFDNTRFVPLAIPVPPSQLGAVAPEASTPGPLSNTSTDTSDKPQEKEELEAAAVLLGLTNEQADSNDTSSSNKDLRNDASRTTMVASTIGNVTEESSTGTASPAPITKNQSFSASTRYYNGSVSLSLPEDEDVLSPLHCFMRKYCLETFSASSEDVSTPRYGKSHGFKVEVGQVGLRCIYCKHLPVGKRPERAVCYPSSLRNIYHSVETFQRRHSLVCTHISPWVRKSIVELTKSSKNRAGGRRQYWEDSARRLGMVDTPRGVRFIRPPGDLGPLGTTPIVGKQESPRKGHGGKPIVQDEDRELVTEYLFLLMEQMQTCYFTEEDRTGGRSKIKDICLNFPGYECRHCHGRAGFGRYFPSSVAALSLANSDRNVYNHLQKCRRCPTQIKNELIRLSKEQSQSKNRRGLRKLFFSRIWDRLHDFPVPVTTVETSARSA